MPAAWTRAAASPGGRRGAGRGPRRGQKARGPGGPRLVRPTNEQLPLPPPAPVLFPRASCPASASPLGEPAQPPSPLPRGLQRILARRRVRPGPTHTPAAACPRGLLPLTLAGRSRAAPCRARPALPARQAPLPPTPPPLYFSPAFCYENLQIAERLTVSTCGATTRLCSCRFAPAAPSASLHLLSDRRMQLTEVQTPLSP